MNPGQPSPFYPGSANAASAPLDAEADAVAMLKHGASPADVYHRLVARGLDGYSARALVDRLVALKQQADALDPGRLRDEITWMLANGARVEDATVHLVQRGVAEEHARPEVERLAARLRECTPCDGCRTPTHASEVWFDRHGRQLCRRCHAKDEIGAANRRVIESTLEAVGVSAFAVQIANGAAYARESAAVPWCPRCNAYSGTPVSTLQAAERARVAPGWSFVCGRCWAGLR